MISERTFPQPFPDGKEHKTTVWENHRLGEEHMHVENWRLSVTVKGGEN